MIHDQESEGRSIKLCETRQGIQISRLTSYSADVYNFALAAFRLLFSSILSIPLDLQNFQDVYLNPQSDGCFLVARESSAGPEQKIVGILAYRPYIHRALTPSGELNQDLLWQGKRTVEVVRLYILPEHRGKGLAQSMILALIDQAKKEGIQVMYLHTQPFLTGAEELWVKMGWKVLVRDQDHWESIHMVMFL